MIAFTATNINIIKIAYSPNPPNAAAAGVADAGCPKLKAGVVPKVDIFGVEL